MTYCIVHKVDRLARNRLDDVEIHLALIEAGVTLVSATENIDETPSGALLQGLMSSIAEFYFKNLATEVSKGLMQWVATGGTPMRAPGGYLNVRKRDEKEREHRAVRWTRRGLRSSGGCSSSTPPVSTPPSTSSPIQPHAAWLPIRRSKARRGL